MENPRKVYVISTKYFEILFSEKSTYTAKVISENADRLYEMAQKNVAVENSRKISIIISPDSDTFSVKYTPTPYNRIVIYEAVPDFEDSNFENILLSCFYNELIHQVFQSTRGELETLISKTIKTDNLQPVYLENMTFSFLEGIQFLEEQTEILQTGETQNQNHNISDSASGFSSDSLLQGHFNDGYFLQILSQAKLENKFPSFMQSLGAMDIYPGTEISKACGCGFCAYLQQQFGIEKFYEFCKDCGRFNLYSTEGVFLKIYGISINKAWEAFENTIPLPADLENLHQLEEKSTEILPYENKGLYQQLLYSPYGIIWYDEIRHEVAIYASENNFIFNKLNTGLYGRTLLFLADEINRLSLSSDGRYLVVSYKKNKYRNNLKQNDAAIYDLKNRRFTGEHFPLRDACFITLQDETSGIAGIFDNNNYASIRIYSVDFSTSSINTLLEKEFSPDFIPFSLVSTENGNLYSIINHSTEQFLYKWNFYENSDDLYKLKTTENNQIRLRNLSINQNPFNNQENYSSVLTFDYVPLNKDDFSFTKFGFIFLNRSMTPKQLWLCSDNVSGGMNFTVIKNDELYYSAIKYDCGEIRKIKISDVHFNSGNIEQNRKINPFSKNDSDNFNTFSNYSADLNQFTNYKIYRQFPEIFKGSVTPFMPITEISVEDGAETKPGLGLTFKSYSDKYANNQIFASGSLDFFNLTWNKYSNPSKNLQNKIQEAKEENKHDYSAALLYKNTATAGDIFAGGIFKATKDGEYNLNGLTGAAFSIPLGMQFRSLNISFQSDYNASTNFRNKIFKDYYTTLPAGTSLFKTYQNALLHSKIQYTNIHQFGFSPYELRGFSIEINSNIFWDIGLSAVDTGNEVLNSQIRLFTGNNFFKPSQINLGFAASAKIPQLSFIKDYNNNILCFPTSIDFELFNENGTAMDLKAETLVFGKEIQNGINFMHLYFSRFGLKIAYDYSLIYDETKVSPPDLRDFSKFYSSFVNTTIQDSVALTAELDFIPAIGFLSSAMLHSDFIFEYYFRSQTTKFSASIKLNY